MKSKRNIFVNHDVKLYNNEMKYKKEGKLMGEKYFDYIQEYSLKKDNFLELGIGFGDTVRLIDSNYSNVVVLDAEEELINQYSTLYPDITFFHTYFENFETTKLFDNIGIGFVLDLVDDPTQLLKKYAELLTDGGKIYLSTGNSSSLHRMIAYNADLIDDIKETSQIKKEFNYQSNYTFDELIELFEKVGLDVIVAHGLMIKPFSTSQINSLKLDQKVYNSLAETAKNLPRISNACFFVLEKK